MLSIELFFQMDKDPDVRVEALFVIGKQMPVKIGQERKKSMPYNWQQYYFFASKYNPDSIQMYVVYFLIGSIITLKL